MAHAERSPSSSDRWMECPGSVPLSAGIEDHGSEFAAEGTAAHELSERILLGSDGLSLVGKKAENGVEFTADMHRDVQPYITMVRDLVALGGELHVEVKLDISNWTLEEGAHGTSDAVVILDDELIVADLKFGRGVVVDAERNKQLQIYALAALDQFDLSHGPFNKVRMIISQPRLGALSEWSCSVEDLLEFGRTVRLASTTVEEAKLAFITMKPADFAAEWLTPTEKGCHFCKAKANCPKLAAEVLDMFDTINPDADVIVSDEQQHEHADASGNTAVWDTDLAKAMSKVGMVEAWCKAIRARVESELLAGRAVEGFKLVQGRRGPRKWSDADEAEKMLKAFRLKTEQMYDLSLISPTSAEKLAGAKALGPRQWTRLQALVTQSDGSPSVAPASDKRPALVVASTLDDFADLDAVGTDPQPNPSVDDLM